MMCRKWIRGSNYWKRIIVIMNLMKYFELFGESFCVVSCVVVVFVIGVMVGKLDCRECR